MHALIHSFLPLQEQVLSFQAAWGYSQVINKILKQLLENEKQKKCGIKSLPVIPFSMVFCDVNNIKPVSSLDPAVISAFLSLLKVFPTGL